VSALLLVRHGQASFGAGDYDKLSAVGAGQSRLLGAAWRARGIVPTLIVRGGLRRHRETAERLLEGLDSPVPVEIDPGWDEFDHADVVAVHKPGYRNPLIMKAGLARTLRPKQAFQEIFEATTERWASGSADGYAESFTTFADRVNQSLTTLAAHATGTVAVITSGGPISMAASQALLGNASAWLQLNRVAINTGVTKLIHGRRGTSLVSFNGHEHLEQDQRLLTYR
jgi:broad specificity phosphatase PhoE